jgi:hypothetical protein
VRGAVGITAGDWTGSNRWNVIDATRLGSPAAAACADGMLLPARSAARMRTW